MGHWRSLGSQDACYDMESKPYQLVPNLQFVTCTLAFFGSQLLYVVRHVEKASYCGWTVGEGLTLSSACISFESGFVESTLWFNQDVRPLLLCYQSPLLLCQAIHLLGPEEAQYF